MLYANINSSSSKFSKMQRLCNQHFVQMIPIDTPLLAHMFVWMATDHLVGDVQEWQLTVLLSYTMDMHGCTQFYPRWTYVTMQSYLGGCEFTDTILLMGTSMTAHYLIQCFFAMDLMPQVFVLFHLYHKCMWCLNVNWVRHKEPILAIIYDGGVCACY